MTRDDIIRMANETKFDIFEIQMSSKSDEWVEMPEFVQNDKKPFAKIIFRFANGK